MADKKLILPGHMQNKGSHMTTEERLEATGEVVMDNMKRLHAHEEALAQIINVINQLQQELHLTAGALNTALAALDAAGIEPPPMPTEEEE